MCHPFGRDVLKFVCAFLAFQEFWLWEFSLPVVAEAPGLIGAPPDDTEKKFRNVNSIGKQLIINIFKASKKFKCLTEFSLVLFLDIKHFY